MQNVDSSTRVSVSPSPPSEALERLAHGGSTRFTLPPANRLTVTTPRLPRRRLASPSHPMGHPPFPDERGRWALSLDDGPRTLTGGVAIRGGGACPD